MRTFSAKGDNITLTAGMDSYISARDNILSPETIRGYDVIRHNRFQIYMDDAVKNIDWQKACNLETKAYSAKTLKNIWMLVASALREAGTIPPKVQLPQVVQTERPYLDPDQIKIFVKAVKGELWEIPALLALHSLRRSEICALAWSNIDLKNKRVKVSGAAVYDKNRNFILKPTNKSSASQRYIPIMIPELFTALQECEDKSGRVVTCAPDTIRSRINRVCKTHNLPLVSIYGLRHSFASLSLSP